MAWAPASRVQSPSIQERGAGAQRSPGGWESGWQRENVDGWRRAPGLRVGVGGSQTQPCRSDQSHWTIPTPPKDRSQVLPPPPCWVTPDNPLPSLSFILKSGCLSRKLTIGLEEESMPVGSERSASQARPPLLTSPGAHRPSPPRWATPRCPSPAPHPFQQPAALSH